MDRELSALEDWAVEQILEWKHQLEATQKATGKAPSDLKRALRFGNELVFNPEAYANMLETARSKGMSAKQIIQEIRKIETGLLDSKKVLMSDWLHHRTAQRTGGDTFLYMKGDERRAAREILRGEGIFLGNVDENFISLPGVLHTKKTQGVEKQWLDSLSFDEKSKLYLPVDQGGSGLVYAHQTGASSFTISGTAEKPWLMSAEEGASHLRRSATIQRAETQAAEDVLRGSSFVEEVQKLPGGVGAYDDPTVTRLSYDVEDIGPAFQRLLNYKGSAATLDMETMGELVAQRKAFPNRLIGGTRRAQMAALAGAGLAGVSMLGTAASAAETVGRGQIAAETKDPMDIVQAGLSGLSLAGDVIPVVGEVVSTPADALNMAIDRRRERATEAAAYKQTAQTLEKNPYKPALTEDGSIPELVQTEKSALEKITSDPLNELEYVGKQILGGLKAVGGAILFGF